MNEGVQYSETTEGEHLTPQVNRQDGRRNIFEDVVAEENVFQFIGSASRHTTTARSVIAKAHTTQCLGDVTDTTIQQISKDRSETTVNNEHRHPQQQTKYFKGPGRTVG